MKVIRTAFTIIILIILLVSTFSTPAITNLTGAGATFPSPIYIKWADSYHKETGKKINYQGIGSSGGIKQIISNTVDFGASDIPLSDKILNQENLFQFPTIIGGVVLVVNLPGIKSNDLIIDGKTLGDIYLGKIKKWNDKEIIKNNPKLKLISKNIAIVRRADSSGTSFIFTSYLTKVNKDWRLKVGSGTSVNWPIGLGGKGNDGVAAFVQRISGSIGYVEYAYAKKNNLIYTKLVSSNGKPVSPTLESFSNAAKHVNWSKSFSQDLTNQKGENVWPISSTTFILVHKEKKKSINNSEIIKFFDWAYKNGSNQASNLDYAILPESVINKIRTSWKIFISH